MKMRASAPELVGVGYYAVGRDRSPADHGRRRQIIEPHARRRTDGEDGAVGLDEDLVSARKLGGAHVANGGVRMRLATRRQRQQERQHRYLPAHRSISGATM